MENKYFCTTFNKNYLAHAKTLYESLVSVMPNAKLLMMCMDEESYQVLKNINYPSAILAKASDMEAQNPKLLIAKGNRSMVEYFYTCSSSVCVYALENIENIDSITYLDADLYFFSNPNIIFDEIGSSSIAIIEHKFSKFTRRNKIYGIYNVGWITFKNDSEGNKCLKNWNENCIEWCYQKLEGDKYADQKYLDKWTTEYKNVCVIKNLGANLAVWNVSNYKLSNRNGKIFVDEDVLIFYHFTSLKQIEKFKFKTDLSRVFKSTKGILKNDIYLPYIENIIKNQDSNNIFIAKKDTQFENYFLKLIQYSRKMRELLFPDIIKINSALGIKRRF